MKTILKMSFIAILSILFLSSFSLREQPQDPPRGEKKHLKMVKIEDGKKTVIDTLIAGDADAMSWFSDSDFTSGIDSAIRDKFQKFEIEIEENDGTQKIFVFADENGIRTSHDLDITTEMISDGDSITSVIVMKHGDGKIEKKIIHLNHDPRFVHVPKPPYPPMPMHKILKHSDDKMVIHLDAPGIISFKKKDLSDGREKIEIIRKKPKMRK